jgi:hypothetical protein
MTKSMKLIQLAALTACASSAAAQELVDSPAPAEMRLDPVGFPPRAYSGRTIEVVYDNLSNVFTNGTGGNFLGACENVIDDCRFAPGPWENATDRLIGETSYGIEINSTCTSGEQLLLIFWRSTDLSYLGASGAGSPMLSQAASPLGVVRVNLGVMCGSPGLYHLTSNLNGLPGGGVSVPNGEPGVVVEIAWVTNGCVPGNYRDLSSCLLSACGSTSTRGIAVGSNSLEPAASATNPGTANPATVGSTFPDYGRDISNATMCPNIGWFVGNGGAPVNTGNVEHRFIVVTPTTGPNTGIPTTAGMQVLLRGTAVCAPPSTGVTSLGSIPDAGLDTTGNVVPHGVQWYSLNLATNADDAGLHFLDIDTEGSAADISIALFDPTGAFAGGLDAGFDDDSGSGTSAQLSFGVGRRAAVGDGLQYDGRNGQLAAGTYYLAVMPNASTAAPCFTAIGSNHAGGSYQLHLRTNVNGTPLAASVAPLINGQDYGVLDPTARTTVPGVGQQTGLHGVIWSRIVLATPADARHFLDLDYGPRSSQQADGVAYIFNSNGDLVYYSDNRAGPISPLLPQFSIGRAGARDYYTGSPLFNGNTPVGASAGLSAGTYFLANALHLPQDLGAAPGANRRWHVRGTSGLSLSLGADALTGAGGLCCRNDYNDDGDVGTDADIEAFFACLAGDCCPTCPPNADFNCDGDSGTDADIEAFFRILAGGSC